MNLTFKGFVRGYCRELTGLPTDNLRKLSRAVMTGKPLAAEAVMVFAAIQGKADYLYSLTAGSWLGEGYASVLDNLRDPEAVEPFLQSEAAPERYRKVWSAYVARRDAIEVDRQLIALMRRKTLEVMKNQDMTIYCLCQQLSLNKGNTYAYLNKGDATKVSRETAWRIMNFVEAA